MRRNAAFKKRYSKGGSSGDFDSNNNELYHDSEARYLQGGNAKHEDILNTKFIFAEDPSLTVKLSDFRSSPPRFRPTTQRSPVTSTTTTVPSTLLTVVNRTSVPVQTASTIQEDVQSTFTTDRATEGSTTDTTVEQGTEEDATQSSRTTEKTGEVLFQDMEEEKPNRVQPLNFNQLKGV